MRTKFNEDQLVFGFPPPILLLDAVIEFDTCSTCANQKKNPSLNICPYFASYWSSIIESYFFVADTALDKILVLYLWNILV